MALDENETSELTTSVLSTETEPLHPLGIITLSQVDSVKPAD